MAGRTRSVLALWDEAHRLAQTDPSQARQKYIDLAALLNTFENETTQGLQERRECWNDEDLISFLPEFAKHLFDSGLYSSTRDIDDRLVLCLERRGAAKSELAIESRHRMAICYEMLGAMTEAIQLHRANAMVWEALGNPLLAARTYAHLAIDLRTIGKEDTAGGFQDKLKEITERLLATFPVKHAKVLIRQGIESETLGRYDSAVKAFSEATTLIKALNSEGDSRQAGLLICEPWKQLCQSRETTFVDNSSAIVENETSAVEFPAKIT
jgi:tetratricopeptide (TPR) repeat protein